MLKINFQKFALILFFSGILTMPAHAYAGPGVAIGAIIVFITVILTFFASTLITIFNFIRKVLISLTKKLKRKNNLKKVKK